jgi:threonine dehydrogenase-like Zn-dependent dehydrogenase
LVIGHEGFGQVEAVGPNVSELKPGDYVVATVRRPGRSLYDLIGTNDMTTDIAVVQQADHEVALVGLGNGVSVRIARKNIVLNKQNMRWECEANN